MYPYVKCPSCGNLLGHVYRLFEQMKALKNEKNAEDLVDIFNLLHIDTYCCRTRLTRPKEFNKFLHDN